MAVVLFDLIVTPLYSSSKIATLCSALVVPIPTSPSEVIRSLSVKDEEFLNFIDPSTKDWIRATAVFWVLKSSPPIFSVVVVLFDLIVTPLYPVSKTVTLCSAPVVPIPTEPSDVIRIASYSPLLETINCRFEFKFPVEILSTPNLTLPACK